MKRTLFDRPLARHYSHFLEHPEFIVEDPVLGPRSVIRIREDFFAEGIDLEQNLQSMIRNDIRTQPVMDYMMALYLLERRVDDMAAFLPVYLEEAPQLPRLLDEALLVYKITRREENQTNIAVSEPTMRRFEEYAGILRQYRDQNEAARILHPRFGNSFWFYLNFSELIGY
jgi:hypothetical protein